MRDLVRRFIEWLSPWNTAGLDDDAQLRALERRMAALDAVVETQRNLRERERRGADKEQPDHA